MYRKPGFIIWSSAIVCVAFGIASVYMVLHPTSDLEGGKAFFILVLGVAAAIGSLWRIVRLYRTAGAVSDVSSLQIGAILKPSRNRAMAVGIGLFILGATPLAILDGMTPAMGAVAWALALMGAAVSAAVVAGYLPIGHIELREDGLVLVTRGAPLILPWERIVRVEGGEYTGNPALFLWFDDAESLPVPPEKRRAFKRQVAFCRNWMGSDYYMLTTAYKVDLPSLVAAIAHHSAGRTAVAGVPE